MENINHKGNVVEIMSSWTQTNDDNDNNKIKNKLNSKIKIDILFKVKNTFCCCQSFKVFSLQIYAHQPQVLALLTFSFNTILMFCVGNTN